MGILHKEFLAVILLFSIAAFYSSYSDFVAEGNAISRMPSWATWAAVPWDVQTGETLVSASYQDGKAVVTASGTYIWTTGYIWNPKARQWRQFTFPHNTEYPGWSSSEVIAEVPVEAGSLISGDNYVLAYTCQWKNERWYCGCLNDRTGADGALLSCGRWQMQTFTKAPDRSCFDFKTSSQCNANRNLGSNVQCEWTEFPSRAPVCVAYSGSCSDLAENDCRNSQYQNFRCSWENNRCINTEYRSARRASESSQNTMSGFVTGMTIDDVDTPYCPGFQRDFTGREDLFRSECPEGCVAYGGVSSALYCVFPGRFYTKGDIAAIRSAYSYGDSANRCAFTYCECISGGSDNANCNRFHSRTSSGQYYRTAGESNGCIWQGEPRGGFCIAAESANTRMGQSTAAREGRTCPLEGTLQMQENDCFVCNTDGKWTKIDEKTDLAEFTICETHQTGRLERAMTTAFVDKAEIDRRNPQEDYGDPVLAQAYRDEIVRMVWRDSVDYKTEARKQYDRLREAAGDERENFNIPDPDLIDIEFALLVNDTRLRIDAGGFTASEMEVYRRFQRELGINDSLTFLYMNYDSGEKYFICTFEGESCESPCKVKPIKNFDQEGKYLGDINECVYDMPKNSNVVLDEYLITNSIPIENIDETIAVIKKKERQFSVIPMDSSAGNSLLQLSVQQLTDFRTLMDRGLLRDGTRISPDGESLDINKLPMMRSYFQAADYVRDSDMTPLEKINFIYPIIHRMANNEYDEESVSFGGMKRVINPSTFTYIWSEMILPHETRSGICRDKAMLYATLLQYVGIDARHQSGLLPMYVPSNERKRGTLKIADVSFQSGAHAWVRINTPGCSFEIDPTWYNDTANIVPVHRVTQPCSG